MTDPARWREVLPNKADEARVARMWSRIQARRDAARWQAGFIPSRRWVWGGAASALGVLMLGIGFIAWSSGGSSALEWEGAPLPRVFESNRTYVFSDASELVTSDETTVDVLESRSRRVRLALRSGEARFSVTPGGSRRWEVVTGGVTVEVVGTVFHVRRRAGRVRVAVERGSVLVHGPTVIDRVQRLEAGESLTVADSDRGTAARRDESSFGRSERHDEASSLDPEESKIGATSIDLPAEEEAPALTADSDNPSNDVHDAGRVTTLLHRADALRLAGRPEEAARALEEVVQQHSGDSRAALAAYSVARLRLEVLRQPVRAARDFERSLELGLDDPLREAALAGRVESFGQAGREPQARSAAARYLERYPNGRYREQVSAWQ